MTVIEELYECLFVLMVCRFRLFAPLLLEIAAVGRWQRQPLGSPLYGAGGARPIRGSDGACHVSRASGACRGPPRCGLCDASGDTWRD